MPTNDWMDAETRVERARDLYEKGRWVEAAAELRAAIEVNPHNADWHFNLALTFDALEEFEHAAQAYAAALELESDDLETLNCLGVDMTRLERYAEALKHFERIQKLDPNYEGSYCNRIVTYTEMGDHDNAELMFYLARQIKDDCPLCFLNVGQSFFARGQFDRAISCWQQALVLDDQQPEAHSRIAEAYWAKGDLDKAADHYRAELEQETNNVETLLDLGELMVEMGNYIEAGEKFRAVLAQAPDHAGAHYCLGELALKQGKLAQAEEQFRLVLRIKRDYPGAHTRLGQLLLGTGRSKHAAKHLLAELHHCGDDAEMLQELGQLLIEARNLQRANSVLLRLVRLRPADAVAQHNLAVSYFMMDRYEDGIRHCRRALKIKQDYPLALYNLALAHVRKGELFRARRYVSRALTLAPADAQIRHLSTRLGMGNFWTSIKDRLRGLSHRWK